MFSGCLRGRFEFWFFAKSADGTAHDAGERPETDAPIGLINLAKEELAAATNDRLDRFHG